MAETPTPPNCPHCHNPMQVADQVIVEGKVIAVRYICGCQNPPTHLNWHAGQAGASR